MTNQDLRSHAGVSWKKLPAGLAAAFLLLAAPAYASINFSNVSWSLVDTGSTPFLWNTIAKAPTAADITYADTSSQTALTFNLPAGIATAGPSIATLTATIPVNAGDILNGTWANLNNLNINNPLGNPVTILISVTNGGTTNNMFGPTTYTNTSEPPNAPPITPSAAFGGTENETITVQFQMPSGTAISNTSATSFTLTFTSN